MDGLLMHCGGVPATRDEIAVVPLPVKTETYQPVAHNLLVDKVISITQDVLPVQLDAEAFGLGAKGDQLFAHLRFKNGRTRTRTDMGLCVGLVNSYDKSLKVRFAAGSSIFVCDNLMLSGGITYSRLHTRNVWEDLVDAILERIAQAESNFDSVARDADRMGRMDITDLCAYRVMGQLYGERMLTGPMISEARREWDTPSHEAFEPRTKWSLYNAFTVALKRSRPDKVMEHHLRLHEFFNGIEFDAVAVA